MEYLFTKEEVWLDKWDAFVMMNSKGSHLILTDWLNSYSSYGFDFELGILIDNNEIVGGFGAIIPKFLFFKFYIIPHGPIFLEGHSNHFNNCLINIKTRAKALKCCYAQFSVPVSTNSIISKQSYLPSQLNIDGSGFLAGRMFDYIYSSYGLNWLDVSNIKSENELLKELGSHATRNIKTAYKNKLVLSEAKTEEAIKNAYKLVTLNAKNSGYNVRSFNEFKASLIRLIHEKRAIFLVAHKDGEIKGSAFYVRNKNSLTYIFGGTLKERPDLRVGYFLHWEAIKRVFHNKYSGYNISMGGSKGVLRFKSQFNTQQIFYESPHYYFVLNKFVFNMFQFSKKYLKLYKKRLSTLLSKFNRNN